MPKINIRNLKQNISDYKYRSKLTRKDDLIEFVELTKMNLNDINDYLDSDIKITAKNKKNVLVNEYLIKKDFDRREAEITRQEQEFDEDDEDEVIFEEANDDFEDDYVDEEGRKINVEDLFIGAIETPELFEYRMNTKDSDDFDIEHAPYNMSEINYGFEIDDYRIVEKDNYNNCIIDLKPEHLKYYDSLPHYLAKNIFSDRNINKPVIIRLIMFNFSDKKKYVVQEFQFGKFDYIINKQLFKNYKNNFIENGQYDGGNTVFSDLYKLAELSNLHVIPQIQFLFPERMRHYEITLTNEQYFRHGITNCFLTPLLNYYESLKKSYVNKTKINYINSLLKMFKGGVPEHYIKTICDKLVCSVNIYDVYRNIDKIYEGKNSKKIFKLINTKYNHVDLFKNDNDFEIEELQQSELNNKYNELLESNKYFIFKMNGKRDIKEIITETDKYLLKSHYSEYSREFRKKIDIYKYCAIEYMENWRYSQKFTQKTLTDEDKKIKNLSDYLASGVHSNNCVDFKNIELFRNKNVSEIDQIKSHTQFKKCKYYKGFLGKPTDIFRIIDIDESEYIKFLNNVIGIFTITIINNDNVKVMNYINKLNIYQINQQIVLPSPELLFIIDLGFKIKIHFGCFSPIGCNFDFEFDDVMINQKDGKLPYYSKFCGQLFFKSEYNEVYCHHDPKLINTFSDNYGIRQYEVITQSITRLNCHKNKSIWYPQVYAFILSYARMNVMNQLFNISFDNVLRIVGDGIYIYDQGAKYNLCESFRIKSNSLKHNTAAKCFIYTECIDQMNEKWQMEIIGNKLTKFYDQQQIYYIGCGGGGKTYNALTDKCFFNVLYVAPSHKLLRAKKNEFPNIKSATLAKLTGSKKLNKEEYEEHKKEKLNKYLNSFTVKKTGNALEIVTKKFNDEFDKKFKNIGCLPYSEKHYPSVIICDEVTQYTEGQRKQIISMYPKSKIIFCGDIDKNGIHYQLPNVSGEAFKLGDNIVEFNENRRCKDPVLLKKLNAIRERIKGNWNKKQLLDFVINKKLFNIVSKDNVHKLYTIDDYILCSKHIYIDEWTEKFKGKFNKEKYYVNKNSVNYCNGDIVISDVKPPSSDIKHAFTCHAIQGETIKNKIFIDTRNLFENQMLYTALSRAQYGNQIYLIR